MVFGRVLPSVAIGCLWRTRAESRRNAHSYAYGGANRPTYGDGHSSAHTHGHANSNGDSHPLSHSNAHSNCNGDYRGHSPTRPNRFQFR